MNAVGVSGVSPSRREPAARWWQILLVALVALSARLPQLDHPPHADEMFHVLAARSLLAEGTPELEPGRMYPRALLYTAAVAASFRAFGESFVAARLPALLALAALAALLFAWLSPHAGTLGAVVAALLLTIDPTAISLSQFARFYTAQALCFWAGVMWLHAAVTEPASRLRLLLSAALAWLLALHFQVETLPAIALALAWAVFWQRHQIRAWWRRARPGARVGAAAGLLLLGAGAAAWALGPGREFLALFEYSDLWAAAQRENERFYHWQLAGRYPLLWAAFPILLIAAVRRSPSVATVAATTFIGVFLLLSFAAWKHERYLFHVLPGFFILVGLGVAELVPALGNLAVQAASRITGHTPGPRGASRIGTVAVLVAVAGAVSTSGAVSSFVRHVAGTAYRTASTAPPDYEAARGSIEPLLPQAEIFIASAPMKAKYFYGRLDLSLLATRTWGRRGVVREFEVQRDYGRPNISSPASVELVHRCTGSGLVLVENSHWGRRWGVSDSVLRRLAQWTTPVPLAPEWRLRALTWRHPVSDETRAAPECRRLFTHLGRVSISQ